MKYRNAAVMLVSISVAACGSGGVETTPPPPPPPPANSDIGNLRASEAFSSDAAGMRAEMRSELKSGVNFTSSKTSELIPGKFSISYDYYAKKYTLVADRTEKSFSTSTFNRLREGQTMAESHEEPRRSSYFLNKIKTNAKDKPRNKYTAIGIWQENYFNEGLTEFERDIFLFTYGLATPKSGRPASGIALYKTDIEGISEAPGEISRNFSGEGDFSVDFTENLFSTHIYLTERNSNNESSYTGDGIDFTASGKLPSFDATFSGRALYRGLLGSAAGTISGRFYGPAAEEVGAAFSASNEEGMTVVGAMTGQRDSSITTRNLGVDNLTNNQLFLTHSAYGFDGEIEWLGSTNFRLLTPSPELLGGSYALNEDGHNAGTEFDEYRKAVSDGSVGQDVLVKLYKPDQSDGELALTYASFLEYTNTEAQQWSQIPAYYASFGPETETRVIRAKTGTATYSGIVRGTGRNSSNSYYDVKGSSQLSVNFDTEGYTGMLKMQGEPENGESVDFGAYDFAGQIKSGSVKGTVFRNGSDVGNLTPYFYGPDAEEIVAPFAITLPDGVPGQGISISGVAAARRP